MRVSMRTMAIIRLNSRAISHVSVSADIVVNTIMNSFQAITSASSITSGVITERQPGVDPGKQIEGLAAKIRLVASELAVVETGH